MAPPPADLRKIAVEGFDLIDKFYGPSRRSSGKEVMMEESGVICKLPSGHHFGGISVVNYYPKGKPQNRCGRPFKF